MKRLALLFLLVAGCGERSATAADRIECALNGAAAFAPTCTLERDPADRALLVLRGANGGFRRLRVAADGSLDAADGAEPAKVEPLPGGRVEVTVGSDRYRLPARIR